MLLVSSRPALHVRVSALSRVLVTLQSTASEMHDFLLSMAVCHTVVPERNPLDESEIYYQASSPGGTQLREDGGGGGVGVTFKTPEIQHEITKFTRWSPRCITDV